MTFSGNRDRQIKTQRHSFQNKNGGVPAGDILMTIHVYLVSLDIRGKYKWCMHKYNTCLCYHNNIYPG